MAMTVLPMIPVLKSKRLVVLRVVFGALCRSRHDSVANVDLLLANMDGMNDRKACFRTVIALIIGDEEPMLFNGIVEGCITHECHGESGFDMTLCSGRMARSVLLPR